MRLRTQAPDVEIVDIEDAGDRLHRDADFAELKIAGCAFEQDVERLADDADGTPEDHAGDEDGENGVDPHHAGKQDCGASGDDCGGRKRVAQHVQKDAADIHVSGEARKQGGYRAVHQDTGRGDVHHQLRLNGDRSADAMDGGDGDPG